MVKVLFGTQCQVKKEECVNHVFRRVATALRNLSKQVGNDVKGKILGGKERLTDYKISELQQYFGKKM